MGTRKCLSVPTREQAGTFYVDIELCCGCQLVPAKRLPRYPRCYSVLEGVGVDNSTILLSLPRCPFPECAVRGVCVDDELQELSGGGRCARKQLERCMQVPESTQGSGKSFFPTENCPPLRRNCLPPKRMFPPVAEENVAACRKRKLSVGKKVSNQDAKKTASQKEGCLKSIFFCSERLLPLNSCAWFWRHIVANAVYCRNLSQDSVCNLH